LYNESPPFYGFLYCPNISQGHLKGGSLFHLKKPDQPNQPNGANEPHRQNKPDIGHIVLKDDIPQVPKKPFGDFLQDCQVYGWKENYFFADSVS